MCANFKPVTLNQLQQLALPEIPFEYHAEVFPNDQMPLLFQSATAKEWRLVNFGLIPKWATAKSEIKYTYNARSETLFDKPSFKESLIKCKFGVVAVDEFYETMYVNGKPQRWAIRRKDRQAIFIAALYEIVKIDNEIIRSATLLTMAAKDHVMMKEFYVPEVEKRSVILIPHQQVGEWLNLKTTNISKYIVGFPAHEYETYHCPKPKTLKIKPQLDIFADINEQDS